MFKDIKTQAKQLLTKNYKHFLLPTIFIMTANALSYLTINLFSSYYFWWEFGGILQLILLPLLLLIHFVVIPISVTVLFKIGILVNSGNVCNLKESVKEFLSIKNVGNIVLINIIPSVFTIFSNITRSEVSMLNVELGFYKIDNTVLFVIYFAGVLVNYLFFLCNYYFALNSSNAIKSIKISFSIMKNKIFKALLLDMSFILWIILLMTVHIIVKLIVCLIIGDITLAMNDYSPILSTLGTAFGFGINFYLTPYMYLTKAEFCKNALSKT